MTTGGCPREYYDNPGNERELLTDIAPAVVALRTGEDSRDPAQREEQINRAERNGSGTRGPAPLHRSATGNLGDCRDAGDGGAERRLPQRVELLPGVEVMPDQGNDSERQGRSSKHMTPHIAAHAGTPTMECACSIRRSHGDKGHFRDPAVDHLRRGRSRHRQRPCPARLIRKNPQPVARPSTSAAHPSTVAVDPTESTA